MPPGDVQYWIAIVLMIALTAATVSAFLLVRRTGAARKWHVCMMALAAVVACVAGGVMLLAESTDD